MGVAIVMGSVRKAQNVNTQDTATITLLTDASSRILASMRISVSTPPPMVSATAAKAAHPKSVEQSKVGKTALPVTACFFAMS